MSERSAEWHLNKSVPISIVLALLAQAALGLTWANRISFEVKDLRSDLQYTRDKLVAQEEAVRDVLRIKGAVDAMKMSLENYTNRLDTVIELRTQMKDVLDELKEVRREYRNSNARLWDETRNLRNALARLGAAPRTATRLPEPPIPERP